MSADSVLAAPTDRGGPAQPLLRVSHLKKRFALRGGGVLEARKYLRAVDDVGFEIAKAETLGMVGESGCGKSTTARLIARLIEPDAGELVFDGDAVGRFGGMALKEFRRNLQMVFQDSAASLNPRLALLDAVAYGPRVHGLSASAARHRAAALLDRVGLAPAQFGARYPHELSGGQRQRVGVARALAMQPSFIVCDEPVSALDVSIQAQIINLLEDLQARLGLTYLFIAHDLAVVRHISNRVAVMYLGHIMEMADRDSLYSAPLHPYTQALFEAVPVPDPLLERARQRKVLGGEVPSPLQPPSGCVFHTRCPMAVEDCKVTVPALREIKPRHYAACIRV